MRYICLKVTVEDLAKTKARQDGNEQFKDGLFGQVELLRKLLEVSPKCTSMADVLQLTRIARKLEKLEGFENPVLELPEDEWQWVKKILDHEKYQTYGAHLMRLFGELLETITEAKTEAA